IIILWAIAAYNRLITLGNKTDEAWSDIDVQLKRRYDLIPNLVSTVKGYATHESTAFENVTKARSAAMGAQTPAAKGQAETTLAGALKSVFAIAEAYPELKANQNFMSLQADLTDTENKIEMARRYYNGNVRDLNNAVQHFPGNLIARSVGVSTREFFQLDNDAAKQPVEVKF
ncbi:MAG TPA: LemA family protein, partial [Candidatus Paceibacterota bacterium]